MTKGQLTLAGWLSMTSAIFAIPSIVMSRLLEEMGGEGAKLSQAILTLVSLGLFLYVIIALRKLLNYRFKFHMVDIYISLLICGNLILSAFSLLALGSQGFESLMNILSMVSFIIFGILAIMFGTRLLKFPGNLYGLLKPFCYTTIASGICLITIVLAPVGIIVGAVSDVILATIFFRAAEHPPSHMEMPSTPIE